MARKLTRQQQESQWRWAVRTRHIDTIDLMLDGGWNVNHATKQGMTALMDAAQTGGRDVFEHLLHKGATPSDAGEYLRLAIDGHAQPQMVAFLRQQPWHTRTADLNALCRALIRGQEDLARTLLAGDLLNAPHFEMRSTQVSVDHPTALSCAAQHCTALLPDMLAMGANPNAATPGGKTVFMQLCGQGVSLRTMERLIQAGANINHTDAMGETPMFVAARRGHTSLMELLRKHGVDISVRNNAGLTALAEANRDARPAANGYSARSLLEQWAAEDQAQEIYQQTAPHQARTVRNRL